MRVRVPVLVLKKVAFAKTKTYWGPMQINLGATTCNDFHADGDLLICAAGEWLGALMLILLI